MGRTFKDSAMMGSLTVGLTPSLFHALNDRQRAEMTKLMTRIAERAYRRGAQQGAHSAKTAPGLLPIDLAKWRYGTSLDFSPSLDRLERPKPAVNRLFMECPELRELGFYEK